MPSFKLILVKGTHEVIDAKDENFSLADTDTGLEVCTFEGDTPPVGKFWQDGTYITAWQNKSEEEKLDMIRAERGLRLAETDYTVLRHRDQFEMRIPSTLSETQHNQVLAYRQALRDFTDTADLTVANFEDITWPTKPDFV